MTLVFLSLIVLALWVNLVGAALALWPAVKNYAVARIAGVLVAGLVLFCLEHFVALGARPPVLPFTLALSGWLMWRHREVLRANWQVELMFAVGFFYCFAWRCGFPDIDMVAERIPDLVFIQDYMAGGRLPATDRWLPPYDVSFYYGYQHYGAGMLGRALGIGSGLTYQFAYCVMVGLVTCAAGSAARALCAWKPAPWLVILAVMVGGNGVIVTLPAMMENSPPIFQSSRFLGFHVAEHEWSLLGRWLGWTFNSPITPAALEFPMDTFSYAVFVGEYHPPLMGFLLLVYALLLLAVIESGATGAPRAWLHALLGATIPMSLIGNVWVAPLQIMLVGGWCMYRACLREKDHWWACIVGGLVATGLAYPHLIAFTSQPIHGHAGLKPTAMLERTPLGQWILMFWPVLGLLVLSIWTGRKQKFALYLVAGWSFLLLFTELVFNDDGFGGTWNRYNSTLKWWPWVYAGITVTVGANNLASANRICRWGSVALLLVMSSFGYKLTRYFVDTGKPSAFRLEGTQWLRQNPPLNELIRILSTRPDGIALESNPVRGNSDHSVVSVFSEKACYLGWAHHEEMLWRGGIPDVAKRMAETTAFYTDKMEDPAEWLTRNDIRYVLWLQRDNIEGNRHFRSLREKIRKDYAWTPVLQEGDGWSIGFWERKTRRRGVAETVSDATPLPGVASVLSR